MEIVSRILLECDLILGRYICTFAEFSLTLQHNTDPEQNTNDSLEEKTLQESFYNLIRVETKLFAIMDIILALAIGIS